MCFLAKKDLENALLCYLVSSPYLVKEKLKLRHTWEYWKFNGQFINRAGRRKLQLYNMSLLPVLYVRVLELRNHRYHLIQLSYYKHNNMTSWKVKSAQGPSIIRCDALFPYTNLVCNILFHDSVIPRYPNKFLWNYF